MKKFWMMLAGPLLLAACGGGELNAPAKVSGYVLAPGGAVLFSNPEPEQLEPRWDAPRAQGQLLVSFRSGGLYAQSKLAALSALNPQTVADGLVSVRTPAGKTDQELFAELRAQGFVVQPNYLYQPLALPNDPGVPGTPGSVEGYKQRYLTQIRATEAWDYLQSKGQANPTGAKVAVLDTGVTANHEDLVGRLASGGKDFCPQLDANFNCVGEDNDPSEITSSDFRGHGTHSIGIIGAATNNAKGIAGLTWSGANILPIKVFGQQAGGGAPSADTVALVKGINYAVDQGAKVINMSLGFILQDDDAPDAALKDAINRAYNEKDVLLVASAGNQPNVGLYYPASDSNVIAVGAVDKNDNLTSYSARPRSGERSVDLVAPGGTNPDCSAGDCILSLSANPTGYEGRAGTSEAAPQVSGVAALMRAYKPNLTAKQIRAALKESARDLGADPAVGAGRLDARAALERIDSPTPPPEDTRNRYPVQVVARQNGQVVRTFNTTMYSGDNRATYELRLPYGTYTLEAKIGPAFNEKTGQQTSDYNATGSAQVTLTEQMREVNRNIQTND
ncbi:serine protease [Deinobacterium chartae]|uniref:Serine protease n=1 Tax=Deinobacterium chartae TaxID=521158 RepID=A0A841I3Y5_9DEIO|nr:S8 family serine peptidase [Deinobacterium chartae]MBB6099130.1 serine protease [Deinobacterium chartae]